MPKLLKKRFISNSTKLSAKRPGKYDSTDPLFEDSAAALAKDFKDNPEELKNHFEEKEHSINSLEDSEVTGELEDISSQELDSWKSQRLELLEHNNDIREATYDRIESGYVSDSSFESESQSESDTQSDQHNSSNSLGSEVQGSEVQGSEGQESAYFPQDSTDVVQTDYSSFDPFDE